MKFDFGTLATTLPVMGKGMLGIFAVIVAIMVTIFILNNMKKKKAEE